LAFLSQSSVAIERSLLDFLCACCHVANNWAMLVIAALQHVAVWLLPESQQQWSPQAQLHVEEGCADWGPWVDSWQHT